MEGFDINHWLKQSESQPQKPAAPAQSVSSSGDDYEIVTQRIEAAGIDITGDYNQWRDLGFALAEGKGEAGRDFFHRISRFYPDYYYGEADKQFTACLNGHGSGITGRTFFSTARKYGINILTVEPSFSKLERRKWSTDLTESTELRNSVDDYMWAPSFSQSIRDSLPQFLQKVISKSSDDNEADLLLLGALACISACLPNYSAIYRDVRVFSNLYLFITASAGSGKSRLDLCSRIVEPIHEERLAEWDALRMNYEAEMVQYDRDRKNKNIKNVVKPKRPALRMLVLPGNTSATAVIQILHDNEEGALIFESEADTLVSSFNSDYGNYSNTFRSAFQHEKISFHRRGDNEHVEQRRPRLSVALSGTPEQVRSLIRSPENGLFSRFMFYYFHTEIEFVDVFKRSKGKPMDEFFQDLGQEYLEFYHVLLSIQPLEFNMTEPQASIFMDYFRENETELYLDFGDGILATNHRLGLICFRIAMILTALRLMETGNFYEDPVCMDEDFNSAMVITRALIQHATKVYCDLFGEKKRERISSQVEEKFFNALPDEFGRQEYIAAAIATGVNPRTAEGYVAKFCKKGGPVERLGYGKYRKTKSSKQ